MTKVNHFPINFLCELPAKSNFLRQLVVTPFLSAAIGQRPRNYLSCCCCSCCCCCCSCCSPFGSFPHYKEFKRKKISPVGILTWDLQNHSPSLYQLSYGDIVIFCLKIYYLFQKSSRRPWISIGRHLLTQDLLCMQPLGPYSWTYCGDFIL